MPIGTGHLFTHLASVDHGNDPISLISVIVDGQTVLDVTLSRLLQTFNSHVSALRDVLPLSNIPRIHTDEIQNGYRITIVQGNIAIKKIH